ncbi:putative lipoprotein [Psychromonas sp. CNPT3]|uniref:ATP-dependent zinc protease family protein n=1 Tax=Psychromonas sp. CNPT3 TaxID=314282 RepID=UPI0002C05AA2|nr:ATP-dependent zinc protease [Psychromonas sp. CNPT3]AGH81869.1 putative lipoprotein [Psychromonas sp. CNPT3]
MKLNKITLFSILSISLLSGCITLNNDDELRQIKSLKNDLIVAQKETEKLQNSLKESQKTLQESQSKTVELNDLIKKTKRSVKTNFKSKKTKRVADKTILGQNEWVYVSQIKENYRARIDTGATTSSISAQDIEIFERDGKRWVRFNLIDENDECKQTLETPVIRMVSIIQSNNSSKGNTNRPVVQLHVRMGDIVNKTEFTLTDRQHMQYPVLIGRSFLQDVALVDVGATYIQDKYKIPKSVSKQSKKVRVNNEG